MSEIYEFQKLRSAIATAEAIGFAIGTLSAVLLIHGLSDKEKEVVELAIEKLKNIKLYE